MSVMTKRVHGWNCLTPAPVCTCVAGDDTVDHYCLDAHDIILGRVITLRWK